MSAQQLELAVLYAYNPPGVGEEAAEVKAQVKYTTPIFSLHQDATMSQQGRQAPGAEMLLLRPLTVEPLGRCCRFSAAYPARLLWLDRTIALLPGFRFQSLARPAAMPPR